MINEKSDNQSKEQFRVVINRDANEALEGFVALLARDADSSKISKSDLANYLFCRITKFVGSSEIAEIRSIFFDAKRALEGILKVASSANDLPDELREALHRHYGIKPTIKEKRVEKSTASDVDNLGAVSS